MATTPTSTLDKAIAALEAELKMACAMPHSTVVEKMKKLAAFRKERQSRK